LVVAALVPVAAWPADWQPVAVSGNERVEIDKARIVRTAPGHTTAWTRLVLGREVADAGGSYSAVQAMNRYDCQAGTFATVRRVYMKAANMVREEAISSPKSMTAAAGSVEERLLKEACRLRTVGDAQQVADAAARAATAPAKPGVMHADMLSASDEPVARTMPVADAAHPEAGADGKLGERPRFIELPKIDKSQVEDPYAGSKPAEPKAAEAKAPPARPEPRSATPVRPEPRRDTKAPSYVAPATGGVSRFERERQLATSGPTRAPVVRRVAPEPAVETRPIHWSYEGDGSPANWAKLRPDYAVCATGRRQSPIDIRDGIKVDLEPIAIDYRRSQFRVLDNGHSIQVNVGEGSSIAIMGRTYQLQQIHFHRPAEERVNGKTYDMGIHFVHRDDEGHLAVIAVLLEKGPEHPLIQAIWNNMPLEVDQEVAPALSVDLNDLLPRDRSYYTYMGSLTTPPCTEDVLWMVFKQPVAISAEQIAIFTRLYKNNARPIQAANGRLIKENR
jgi:carbonic anhydrase